MIRFKLTSSHFWLFFCISAFLFAGCSKTPSKSYRLGRDPTWAYASFDGITENVNAFTNALIQRISEEEGVPLTIINMNSLSLLSWLKQEQNAGILTGLTPTAENREKYQFSDPYLLLGPVLVVRVDSNVNSLEDLKEKFVGVYAFDDSIFVVQKNPAILIQTYENMPTGLADLAVGTLDALVMPVLDANALVSSQYAGILRIATPPLTDKGLRLVTLKGREEALIALFNHGLKQLQDKGEYRRIKANFIF